MHRIFLEKFLAKIVVSVGDLVFLEEIVVAFFLMIYYSLSLIRTKFIFRFGKIVMRAELEMKANIYLHNLVTLIAIKSILENHLMLSLAHWLRKFLLNS